MRVVDANVLLYAVNQDAPQHEAAREWLDSAFGGADRVGLTWTVLLAFIRISTSSSAFRSPLSSGQAISLVQHWLSAPGATNVNPASTHADTLGRLLGASGAAGNIVNDAHLAAVALEHRADVVSYDRDFARFTGLTCRTPDELLRLT